MNTPSSTRLSTPINFNAYIAEFSTFEQRYKKENNLLIARIKELSIPQGYYEDAANINEKISLQERLQTNQHEENLLVAIIDVLLKARDLVEQLPQALQNDPAFLALSKTLASETFNPKYMRTIDLDHHEQNIRAARAALEKLSTKIYPQIKLNP